MGQSGESTEGQGMITAEGGNRGMCRSPRILQTTSGRIDPLRRQDSNLNHWNQNPRCCRYTTADRPGIISLLRARRGLLPPVDAQGER